MITEESLQFNPRMQALINKATARDMQRIPFSHRSENQFILDPQPQNKYHVVPKEDRTFNGIVFDSKREMEHWQFLLMIQQGHEISNLERQTPFLIVEGFYHPQYEKILPITYVSDFKYRNLTFRKGYENRLVVEDSKGGVRTAEYKIKRKLFLKTYPELLFFEV